MLKHLLKDTSQLHSKWFPIFKKGKKDDPDNYRPVILTTPLGKIMEKVILGVTEKHWRDNTVIGQQPTQAHEGKSRLTK